MKKRPTTLVPGIVPGLTERITQVQCPPDQTNYVTCAVTPLADRIMTALFIALTLLALILLIWAGIQYVTSLGNPDAVKKARQRIINIVIAVVLLVAAYTVINLSIDLITGAANLVS